MDKPKNLETMPLQSPAAGVNPETESKERRDCALLNDQGNGDLAENLQVFETPEGMTVYAATDRGFSKKENHDRVVINADISQFSVLDGMSSAGASQILAEEILAHPGNLEEALKKAKSRMTASRVHEGTCLISAELTLQKTLKVYQVGDCGAIVFSPKGDVKFSATHQVRTSFDTLEVDDMKEFGIERTSQELVETLPVDFIKCSP